MKRFKMLLVFQATYYLLTALWGIADIDSFMKVTGPKTDVWLVKTVSILIIPISLCLYSFIFIETNKVPAIVLGASSAAGFAIADFYYSINNVISDVYQVDGLIQIVMLVVWMIFAVQLKTAEPNKPDK